MKICSIYKDVGEADSELQVDSHRIQPHPTMLFPNVAPACTRAALSPALPLLCLYNQPVFVENYKSG